MSRRKTKSLPEVPDLRPRSMDGKSTLIGRLLYDFQAHL